MDEEDLSTYHLVRDEIFAEELQCGDVLPSHDGNTHTVSYVEHAEDGGVFVAIERSDGGRYDFEIGGGEIVGIL